MHGQDAAAAAPDAEEPAQERERRQGCSSNKSNECMVKMQLLLRLMRRSLHKRERGDKDVQVIKVTNAWSRCSCCCA